MIENTFGIQDICIESTAKCYCPLGKDWYTNHFDIHIEVGEFIPDYCELDEWIDTNINGQTMIIERAVSMVYEHIVDTYHPVDCYVKSYVDDAKHSPVTVIK